MLQEKLKKLNTQFPADKEPVSSQQPPSSYAQSSSSYSRPLIQNEDVYSKQTTIGSSMIPNNRSNSCLRNNFKNVSISQQNELSTNAIARNADIMRPRSPHVPEEKASNNEPGRNSEAIDKITKLNEKINERIQSIISNYAKK